MTGFSRRDRAKLTEDLRNELYDLIHEHGRISTLTVAEALGVLEILKHELLMEHADPDFDGDDDD